MQRYRQKHPCAFEPDTIRVLSDALDHAWERVQASRPQINGKAVGAREVLARHIIEIAEEGERDHQRLVQGALLRLKLLEKQAGRLRTGPSRKPDIGPDQEPIERVTRSDVGPALAPNC